MRRNTLWGKEEQTVFQAPQSLGQPEAAYYSGDTVAKVQAALFARGINGSLKESSLKMDGTWDGIVGQGTIAALQSFQEQNGLSVTGLIDKPTLAALGITPTTITPSVTPSIIPTTTSTPVEFFKKHGIWIAVAVLVLIGAALLLGKGKKE